MRKKKHSFPLAAALLLSLLLGLFPAYAADSGGQVSDGLKPADCNGLRVGVMTGTIHDEYAKSYLPDSEISYFSSVSDLALALKSGSIDCFSMDLPTVQNLVHENPEITYIDEPLASVSTAFAISKSEKGALLRDRMNEFLSGLAADGSLDKLRDKWIPYDSRDYVLDWSDLKGKEETLVFACSCSGRPMSYIYEGDVTGYEPELAVLFCREYGYGLDVRITDFSGIIPGLASGIYDFAADGIAVTAERAESVYFSDEDYAVPVVLCVRSDMAPSKGNAYQGLSDLDGKDVTLGIISGMAYEDLYEKYFQESNISYYNSVADILIALKNGQIDGFAMDAPIAKYVAMQNDGVGYIEEILLPVYEYCITFAKTDFGMKLREEFNEYLSGIRDSGDLSRMTENWYAGNKDGRRVDIPETGENGTVHLVADTTLPPLDYISEDGFSGLEIDMVSDFCRQYDYALEIDTAEFSGVLAGVSSGRYDAAAAYIITTPERAESMLFSDPYVREGSLMLVRDGDMDSVETEKGRSAFVEGFEKTFIRENRWKLILRGIGITLLISVFASVFGTLLGFGLCLLRRSGNRLVWTVTGIYIRILQGTPIVVILMILYYLVFAKSGLDGVPVSVIAFSLNFAAYSCEIFRSGIEAVDKGQTEAALAIGYTKSQAFLRIVLPQAAAHFLPVYKGEFISMVKMTSVVGYIAVQDLTKMGDIIRSRTYDAFFPLIATALIYFLLSRLLTLLIQYIEFRIEPKRQSRKLKGVKLQ